MRLDAFLNIHHEKSESSGGDNAAGVVGEGDLDGGQTAAHFFGSGLAVDLLAGGGAKEFHGAVGSDTVAVSASVVSRPPWTMPWGL